MWVISAGINEASARLAKLAQKPWKFQTASLGRFTPAEVSSTFAADVSPGMGVLFTSGRMSFTLFFSASDCTQLCRAYLGQSYAAARELASIAELSNIVVNAITDEIANATGDLLMLTAPSVVEGRRCDIIMRAAKVFRSTDQNGPIISQIKIAAGDLSVDYTILMILPDEFCSRF
jgi:chemotaxis protein CheY-P-specific phosphatase CheC